MSSVREIARIVGVSASTVSRAINNHPTIAPDVRQRVLAAVNRTGYVAPVGKRSTTNIAFLYTGESSFGSPFDSAVMQGMANRMDDFGFDLMILGAGRALQPGETFTQMFHRKGIRGAVIRTDSHTRHLVEVIAAEKFPAVVIGDRFDHPDVHSVYCESRSTSREAVEHLISLGHRRIGFCMNCVDDSDHLDRAAGYRDALEAAGIEYDDRFVFREHARLDGGMQLARKILTMRDAPTAIYVADPFSAVGAMNELERHGLVVPRDISIVGFDDAQLRFITHPQMTAVVQYAEDIGKTAFELLQDLINNRRSVTAEKRVLPTRFEVHGSTAPPSAKD